MAGYSGTPLVKKLGIKPSSRIFVDGGPADYLQLVGALPEGASVAPRLSSKVDLIHLFTKEAAALAAKLEVYRHRIAEDGVIWVSWPKKAARVPTDVTEDVVRELALPLGLVDTKVCAVDEVWSGLKLVIRRENRRSRSPSD
jgi:hypothetical protein